MNWTNNYNGNTVLIYTGVKTEAPEDLQLIQCVSLILAAGADVNLLNCNKYSALMYFSREGHKECVSLLLKAGVYVNVRNKHGESALSLAALADQARCMKVLIEAGADVNNRNTRGGETVLHWACWDVSCLKLLLHSAVKVNRQDVNFLNALQRYLQLPDDVIKENAMLLYAAGEQPDGSTTKTIHDGKKYEQYGQRNGFSLNGRRNKIGENSILFTKSRTRAVSAKLVSRSNTKIFGENRSTREFVFKNSTAGTPITSVQVFTLLHVAGGCGITVGIKSELR